MMIWHSSSLSDIQNELQTDLQNGLSDAIASVRHKAFGENFTLTTSVSPYTSKVVRQFKRPINILLILSSIVFMLIEWLMPTFGVNHMLMSAFVLIITVAFCFLRACKSYICETYITNRQKNTAPMATVIRGGVVKNINSIKVVPGDIIVLKRGGCVPADARLIKSDNLTCNEAALTSSNVPITKDAEFVCTDITPLSQRANTVFSGSWVSHGSGLAVVTEIGDDTEYGKRIAIEREPALSNINENIDGIKKTLNQTVPIISALIFIILVLIMRFSAEGDNLTLLSIFVHAGLIVSVIAATLSSTRLTDITPIVTVIGMKRLKENNISVINSKITNTMGKVNCLCVDKSTITVHDMIAVQLYNGYEMLDLRSGVSNDTAMTLRLAAAASRPDGDSNDRALIQACFDYAKISKDEIDNLYPQLSSLPFDNEEMITISVNMIDGQPYAIIKGAAESVAPRCQTDPTVIIDNADAMGTQALHVVAIAVKQLSSITDTVNPSKEELESGCTFLGLIGFSDPLRAETRAAVIECYDADIKIKMFTGDSLATAKAIARQAGILNDDNQAITGQELMALNQLEFAQAVSDCTTFARITPELRTKIIQTLKDNGNVIAATGRSPKMCVAMDTADIGCAMANCSSDAINRSADIIIDDDSFSSMINIIKGGRNIFENIRNSMHTVLSMNTAVIILEMLGYFIWQTALIKADQLLISVFLINFIMPILISFEPYNRLIRISKRFNFNHCFSEGQNFDIMWQCVVISLASVVAWAISLPLGSSCANICTLSVFCSSSVLMTFSLRSRKSLFVWGFVNNPVCLISVAVITILLLVAANQPIIIPLALLPIIASEIGKIIRSKTNKE